jgi:hypothetical protein
LGGRRHRAVANPFPSPLWVKVLLVATASCLTGVGALHMLREGEGPMSLGRPCTGLDLQAI